MLIAPEVYVSLCRCLVMMRDCLNSMLPRNWPAGLWHRARSAASPRPPAPYYYCRGARPRRVGSSESTSAASRSSAKHIGRAINSARGSTLCCLGAPRAVPRPACFDQQRVSRARMGLHFGDARLGVSVEDSSGRGGRIVGLSNDATAEVRWRDNRKNEVIDLSPPRPARA